jgi:DNA-binding response OmpR family regulator
MSREPTTPGCTVLVIEDDKELVELVEHVLAMCQCHMVQAPTGGAALTMLRRMTAPDRSPCLILLDLMLPDERGEEVHARLQSAGVTVPVVVMSAAADGAQRAARMGVPFLPKPFDLDQLLSLFREHCPSFVAP